MQTQLTRFTGSAKESKKVFSELMDLSAKSPYNLKDIIEPASISLLGAQVSVKNLIPRLKMLGNVSALLNQPLNRLAVLFEQIRSNGRLAGQQVQRLMKMPGGSTVIAEIKKMAKETGHLNFDFRKFAMKGGVNF